MYDSGMATKPDTRTLSVHDLQELRAQIAKLRQSGVSNRETAKLTGVSERHASVVWQRFLAEGAASLNIKRRGRKKGLHEKIGTKQGRKVVELLFQKPAEVGLNGELWTRTRLHCAVGQHLKIQVSVRTLGKCLHQCGMIPQRPINISKADDKKASKWLATEYQKLLYRAEKESGELHWFAEQAVGYHEYDPAATVYSQPFTLLAAIAHQGQIRFMPIKRDATSALFREFMERLVADVDKKIFLLVKRITCLYIDKATEDWLAEHQHKIEMVYLPI